MDDDNMELEESRVTLVMDRTLLDGVQMTPAENIQTSTDVFSPIFQTPSKVISSESFLVPEEFEFPSSAIKREVDKFCEEINQSELEPFDEITIDDSKLVIRDELISTQNSPTDNDTQNAPTDNDTQNTPINKDVKVVIADSLQNYIKFTSERKFQCAHCDWTATTKKKLMSHISSHVEIVPYKCKQCNQGFLSKSGYTRHIQTPHSLGPSKCEVCQKVFKNKRLLSVHKYRTHNKVYKFQCSECEYRATTLGNLKKHAAKHWTDKPFKCDQCSYQTHCKTNIDKHILTHGDVKAYNCTICDATFKTSSVLKNHEKTHNDRPQYRCLYCKALYFSVRRLTDHMKSSHNRDQNTYCDICQTSYIDKNAFKDHRKARKESEYFKCQREECTFKSVSQCKLNFHMLTHNSVKVQQCKICQKSFSNMLHLKSHLQTHSDLIKCNDCGGDYNKKRYLTVELTVHDFFKDKLLTNVQGESVLKVENETDEVTYETPQKPIIDEPADPEAEPYVILEVLKMETESGQNCVQYNLLRATENQEESAPPDESVLRNVEETSDVKTDSMRVKCCNKVHKKMDILKRFESYIKQTMLDNQ